MDALNPIAFSSVGGYYRCNEAPENRLSYKWPGRIKRCDHIVNTEKVHCSLLKEERADWSDLFFFLKTKMLLIWIIYPASANGYQFHRPCGVTSAWTDSKDKTHSLSFAPSPCLPFIYPFTGLRSHTDAYSSLTATSNHSFQVEKK